jgi:hypothetical protein
MLYFLSGVQLIPNIPDRCSCGLMAKLDFVMEFLSSLMEVVSATTHTQLLS